jgi:hypothetical protein
VLAVVAALVAVTASGAGAAKTKCPSSGTPPPGSTVNGGLEVDGTCVLNNVTVHGGIVVDPTGHLQFTNNSTADGGITVNGGELEVDASLAGFPDGTSSRVNGGITLNKASDFDIQTAQINGGINATGSPSAGFLPTICGNSVNGGVSLTDFSAATAWIGEGPGDAIFGVVPCPGNIVHGPISLTNSSFIEVEGNTVSGPAKLSASTLELNGNTFTGPINCSNGTVISPGEPPDPATQSCS